MTRYGRVVTVAAFLMGLLLQAVFWFGLPSSYAAPGTNVSVTNTPTVTISGTATTQPIQNGNASFTTSTAVSVTTSATQIVASNAARKGIILVNLGATNVCYIGNASVVAGPAAGANVGVAINTSGGSLSLAYTGCYTGPIYGITAASTTVVAVLEW